MRVSRAERSVFGDWWYSLDGAMLLALLALLAAGMLASLAASPPVALRLDLDPFFFVKRHAGMAVIAFVVLVAASLLTTRQVLGMGIILFLLSLGLLMVTPFVGESVKGARRWLELGGFSLQPSEFMKPAFVIVCAWLFSLTKTHGNLRPLVISISLFLVVLALLVLQPDYGQTILLILIWGGLFFIAGMPWIWLTGLAGLSIMGLFAAYLLVPHVGKRIDRFFDPTSGDNYQVGHALRSFIEGGWFGKGPGEGTVKQVLPDAHADFIYAVLAEEFGIVACLLLLLVFGFVIWRGMVHARNDKDSFRKLAIAGLMLAFGLQIFINLGVNTALLPAKGMTLPFISYGGSSLLSIALEMGLALGLSRRHRGQARFERSLRGVRGRAS